MKKRIFTFWEPATELPAYIKLCMQTWEKFLPDYEITVLDYSNLNQYLDNKTIKRILCSKTSLPKQADCIRVALLYFHGGIWLDADTIITKEPIMFSHNLVSMIGIPKTDAHLAFISTDSPKTIFMALWLKEIYKRVKIYNFLSRHKLLRKCRRKKWKQCENWDYFGNAIIPRLIQSLPEQEITVIDRDKVGAFPEYSNILVSTDNIDKAKLYERFWFERHEDFDADDVIKHNSGIIMLHNSWTPTRIKSLNEKAF